jgi:hypothetical protein
MTRIVTLTMDELAQIVLDAVQEDRLLDRDEIEPLQLWEVSYHIEKNLQIEGKFEK